MAAPPACPRAPRPTVRLDGSIPTLFGWHPWAGGAIFRSMDASFDTPVGAFSAAVNGDGAVTRLSFERTAGPWPATASEALTRVRDQMLAYAAGGLKRFELPLAPQGNEFQLAAWRVLCGIPYGQTISYGEQARRLGDPGAARAVGTANNRNPIVIVIPCHRVIGADGALVGFGGGLDRKRVLLELEGYLPPSLPF